MNKNFKKKSSNKKFNGNKYDSEPNEKLIIEWIDDLKKFIDMSKEIIVLLSLANVPSLHIMEKRNENFDKLNASQLEYINSILDECTINHKNLVKNMRKNLCSMQKIYNLSSRYIITDQSGNRHIDPKKLRKISEKLMAHVDFCSQFISPSQLKLLKDIDKHQDKYIDKFNLFLKDCMATKSM